MRCPHCNTPIHEHEAGPCLDAWVEWERVGKRLREWDIDPWWQHMLDCYPKFSTDISAAWELVEGMGGIHGFYPFAGGWYFCFYDGSCVGAPTAPLAICRAYIMSRGE